MLQYAQPHRFYHTTEHIVSMLDGHERLSRCHEFKAPKAAELAIFFHDVVYDPARQDNEELSAEAVMVMLRQYTGLYTLETAAEHIRATAKHEKTKNRDTNLIIDLDMAILGQPWPAYERYSQNVWCEYSTTYMPAEYMAGRAKFLTTMIDRGNIFLTDEFAHLNAQALSNMQQERTKCLTFNATTS